MTTQETVAANVRARLAWARISQEQAAGAIGCSARSFAYRLACRYPFQLDELAALAELFEMDDVGAFFRVPEGFAVSTSSRCIGPWAGRKACRRHRTGRPAPARHEAVAA